MDWIMLIRSARNWYVRRQDAWKILYDHAIKSGVEVIFGRPISGMNELRPAILFEDGSSMESDLIVGADGTNNIEI
jgi:2-polyprenyl-6-methoxyphenol hydroxylase-like FAD-dependent oxidoreductase